MGETRPDLPMVGQPQVVRLPAHGAFADAISLREIQPADRGGERIRGSGQKGAQGVREGIADVNIMPAACGSDGCSRINRAAAKIIGPVVSEAEDRSVAVQARFEA